MLTVFCLIFFILFLFKNLFSIFIYKFINFFVRCTFTKDQASPVTKFFNQDYLQIEILGIIMALALYEILASNFFHAAMIFISEIFILIALFILIILIDKYKRYFNLANISYFSLFIY